MKKKRVEKEPQFEQERFKDLKPIKKGSLIASIILFFIVISLIILFYEKKAFQLIGGMGFTQDDSWIHFTLARSINEGHWFCINPGEQTTVSTAPLWTLLMAGLYRFFPDSVLAVHIFGIVTLIAVAFASFFLSLKLFSNFSLAIYSAILVALEWHILFFSLSGMETVLFSSLIIFTLLALGDKPSKKVGILCGLVTLTRPEGSILFLLILANFIIKKAKSASFLSLLIPFIIVVAPVAIFNYTISGHILPNTFYAKHSYYTKDFWKFIGEVFNYFTLSHFGLLMPFFILSFWWQGKELLQKKIGRLSMIGLYFIGFIVAYGIFLPQLYTFGRYIVPLIPAFLILGLGVAWRVLKKWRVQEVYILIVVATFLYTAIKHSETYAYCVENITHLTVDIGKWLNENTEANAVIATHDIGAIPYFSRRYVIDTLGLGTAETIQFLKDEDGLLLYLKKRKVDYIVGYPFVYPKIVARPDVVPVFYKQLSGKIVAGCWHTMVVYKTLWH